jgi:hypothetical protein
LILIDRESKDNNTSLHLILLDAKAAFDSHTQPYAPKGIPGRHWGLIKDLHENDKSVNGKENYHNHSKSIFQLYHSENKLIFNEMRVRAALY